MRPLRLRGALAAPLAALALVLALLALPPAALAAKRSVPQGFFGVMADGPALHPAVDLGGELDRMVDTGVESVRVAFYWADAQPHRSLADIPEEERGRFVDAHGVPTDFSALDRIVLATAARGLRVLPVVMRAPAWAAADPAADNPPPRRTGDYARFLTALIERYGPRGTLWTAHPEVRRLPIRAWQVWNEPNLARYWSQQPYAKGYARVLRSAYRAIHKADPRAQVVLAGLANYSWRALSELYRARVKGAFDAAAVHPYSGHLKNVEKIVRLNRDVMARNGDRRKPILLTEVTWPSAKGKVPRPVGFETTEEGQAHRLAAAFERFARLRRELRIQSVYWYTWLTPDRDSPNAFDYAGLRRLSLDGPPVDKPALAAYRRTALRLEGCARKAAVATRCDQQRTG